ncbi:MAG: glycosyltransferase, partial [Clostridiales bacterium]|nr:glycosyltransferase [Clostridiales bacterium]
YTDKVLDFAWVDDFSKARNFSFEQATKDYILWLDADDVLPPAEAQALMLLKSTLPDDVDGVMMRYATAFDAEGNPTFSYYRERLVRRGRGFLWREPVHEYLEVFGKTITAEITVHHTKPAPPGGERPDAGRNLRIYERQLAQGKELSTRGLYYYARELRDHDRLDEAAAWFRRFLDTGLGWAEDNISACRELAAIYARTDQHDKVLPALFQSFLYDAPRGETCCQIGYHFKARGAWRLAAFWFELALDLKKPEGLLGFTQHDLWGYIPAIECAVCYDRLGESEKAEQFNERAASFKPASEAVAYNRRYFAQRRNGQPSPFMPA